MKEDNLSVVDTSNKLTKEELVELKKLAAMSKTAKALFAIFAGAVALFGIDHIVAAFSRHN